MKWALQHQKRGWGHLLLFLPEATDRKQTHIKNPIVAVRKDVHYIGDDPDIQIQYKFVEGFQIQGNAILHLSYHLFYKRLSNCGASFTLSVLKTHFEGRPGQGWGSSHEFRDIFSHLLHYSIALVTSKHLNTFLKHPSLRGCVTSGSPDCALCWLSAPLSIKFPSVQSVDYRVSYSIKSNAL